MKRIIRRNIFETNSSSTHSVSITDEKESIITNFANKYLGGGCMNEGCVQEEILLLIYPEILVARAFVKKMDNIQSISMSGIEQFSNYTGYASTLKFGGYYIDQNKFENNSFQSLMIAVDALPVYSTNLDQFNFSHSFREFIKFLTGLQGNSSQILNFQFNSCSTGKWGCGAFGGNVFIKFLIQFLACLFADIEFNFSCFNNENHQKIFQKFVNKFINFIEINNVTKGSAFEAFYKLKIKDKNEKILNDYLEELKKLVK